MLPGPDTLELEQAVEKLRETARLGNTSHERSMAITAVETALKPFHDWHVNETTLDVLRGFNATQHVHDAPGKFYRLRPTGEPDDAA